MRIHPDPEKGNLLIALFQTFFGLSTNIVLKNIDVVVLISAIDQNGVKAVFKYRKIGFVDRK
jgi:hypothetical protein